MHNVNSCGFTEPNLKITQQNLLCSRSKKEATQEDTIYQKKETRDLHNHWSTAQLALIFMCKTGLYLTSLFLTKYMHMGVPDTWKPILLSCCIIQTCDLLHGRKNANIYPRYITYELYKHRPAFNPGPQLPLSERSQKNAKRFATAGVLCLRQLEY